MPVNAEGLQHARPDTRRLPEGVVSSWAVVERRISASECAHAHVLQRCAAATQALAERAQVHAAQLDQLRLLRQQQREHRQLRQQLLYGTSL